jgi:hypothetical protein
MILIKPDHNRRIDIPGVQLPVRRPVDIDQSVTGFKNLRTLRIYQFDQGSVIEGHAEEDEVFIVVLGGAVELTLTDDTASTVPVGPIVLSSADNPNASPCAAYLPPGGSYKLVSKSDADVAYARATPSGTRLPRVFFPSTETTVGDIKILLDETTYAERLRLRIVQIDVKDQNAQFSPVHESESAYEGLVHIHTGLAPDITVSRKNENSPNPLSSWDTVAAEPGDNLALNVAAETSGLALIVLAI